MKTLILSILLLINMDILGGPAEAKDPASDLWSELLQRSPYPHTLPLPPPNATVMDGTYAKFETKETPPVPYRRCPDYALRAGYGR